MSASVLLFRRGMHPTFFRLKRAHHSSLGIARGILRPIPPLTPARFDLLYILHEDPRAQVDQKDLTRRLGLHHSTVSKMLTRLEELGLVYREVNEDDCRRRSVHLTESGRRLMSEAVQTVLGDDMATLAVHCALAPLRWFSDDYCRLKVRRTNGTLRRYALALHDTAVPLYAAKAA